MTTRRLAAGEAIDPDRDDLVQYGIAAAVAAGHDPRDVRQWSEGDLLHFINYELLNS